MPYLPEYAPHYAKIKFLFCFIQGENVDGKGWACFECDFHGSDATALEAHLECEHQIDVPGRDPLPVADRNSSEPRPKHKRKSLPKKLQVPSKSTRRRPRPRTALKQNRLSAALKVMRKYLKVIWKLFYSRTL